MVLNWNNTFFLKEIHNIIGNWHHTASVFLILTTQSLIGTTNHEFPIKFQRYPGVIRVGDNGFFPPENSKAGGWALDLVP